MRTLFVLLSLSIVLGICSFIVFFGCNKSSITDVAASNTKQLEIKAKDVDSNYQQTVKALTYKSDSLQKSVQRTNVLLQQAKQVALTKESIIKNLLHQKLNKNEEVLSSGIYESIPLSCDSLQNEITGYIEANNQKDSMYEFQLSQLDSVIAVKDNIAQTSNNAYADLHLLFNESIANQKILAIQNKDLQQQLKRQKTKSKIMTIGTMILTGVAANYLLNR